ncbi:MULTISPECIES: TetR/AcrR family transcriptional regulator [Actinomadura]|uniref:TetR/AcrR family transcriptional regulator n=1 Tax=Actinomadura TaxID=1988 RepID=UPI0003AD5620|nr:TetR/AcrR family transcriptional regulator [Actinomadura madurae]SPT60347.1 Bacterial regulatory proteins, tetR family [Actinomadura madurae]
MVRKYEQRLRAEAAQETRRRILDAVCARLREAPSEPVSIDRIARLARVARPTVYQVFGSRAGLFEAVGADLLDRGGFQDMLRASAHPDAREALRGGIRGVVAMYATHRDVLRALHSMAMLDAAAVGGAVQRLEARRARGMAQTAERLSAANALRPDVTPAEATDVLCLLTSFDGFDHLHTARSRPPEDVARLLIETAERTLLS